MGSRASECLLRGILGTRRLHFSVLLGVGSSIMRKVKVSGSVWIRTLHFPSSLIGFPKGIKMG